MAVTCRTPRPTIERQWVIAGQIGAKIAKLYRGSDHDGEGSVQLPIGRISLTGCELADGFNINIDTIVINREHRQRGYGTRLIQQVCREADRRGVNVVLVAAAIIDKPMSTELLVAWYARLGFSLLDRMPVTGLFVLRYGTNHL